MSEVWHACFSTTHGWYCEACNFHGDLWEAVTHAVKNQFVVSMVQ